MKAVLPFLLTFMCALFAASQAFPSSVEKLTVRMAAKDGGAPGAQSASVTQLGQHFDVIVKNTGRTSIRLWQDSCSLGYSNLSFLLHLDDGSKIPVTKRDIGWEKNPPCWKAIGPGKELAFDVILDPAIWQNVPISRPGQSERLSIQAVYESKMTLAAKKYTVWSGKISSPTVAFSVKQ